MNEQKTEVSILAEAIREAIYFLDAPEIPHNEVDMSISIALKNALAEAEKVGRTFTIEEVELIAREAAINTQISTSYRRQDDNSFTVNIKSEFGERWWQQKEKELLGGE